MKEAKVGDVIKAGELILLTSGSYSGYGVSGIYRAKADVVIPGRRRDYGKTVEIDADNHALSVMPELEELEYIEVWMDS